MKCFTGCFESIVTVVMVMVVTILVVYIMNICNPIWICVMTKKKCD